MPSRFARALARGSGWAGPQALIAAAVLAVACLVLLGWALDNDAMKSIIPGILTMKANTAVAFALMASAGVILATAPSRARWARALILAAMGLAIVTGAQYLVGMDLAVDQVLFREPPGQVGTVHPNRMSPMTVASFVSVGLALLAPMHRMSSRVVVGFAGIALAIASLNVMDWLFGAEVPTIFARYTQMALSTAVLMGMLAVLAIALLPFGGPLQAFAGDAPAARTGRRLILAAIVVPTVVFWLRVVGQEAGLYGTAFGTSIALVVTIGLLLSLVWFTTAVARSAGIRLALTNSELTRGLREQAFTDSLTGLPNRAMFIERLTGALQRDGGSDVAVLFLDVDDFKMVNDLIDHVAGDRLLAELGSRLVHAIRAPADALHGPQTVPRDGFDMVARLGGDEFAILLEGGSAVAAAGVARRVIEAVRQPVNLGERHVRVSVSVGAVVIDSLPRPTVEEVLRNADIAMYHAKRRLKGTFAMYEPELGAVASRSIALAGDLRKAIANSQLRLVFQPIVRLADGQLMGAEALVRWRHPVYGDVMPGEFIPLAEQSGAIVGLGSWLMDAACRELAAWTRLQLPRTGPAPVLGINVSARELADQNYPKRLQAAMDKYGVPGSALVIEITETALVSDGPATVAALRRLRALGVGISLDDFGTGYSSLTQVADFPITTLKIDRSFVSGDKVRANDWIIARSIIALAKSFRVDVIAEGIEHEDERRVLVEAGCEYGQGYLFAAPVPATEIQSMYVARARGAGHPGSGSPDAPDAVSVEEDPRIRMLELAGPQSARLRGEVRGPTDT